MDDDLRLAKKLQKYYDEKEKKMEVKKSTHSKAVVPVHKGPPLDSLTHPDWETADPNPDIYNLFQIFDKRFFWSNLGGVEVKWSPRMTSCAGICTYKGKAGCIISLSAPLLKLRPRKDLIETLLHEMIHAFLFVTKNFKDRSDHGPEFHKHMYRINQEGGTKITVYHSFHDEVKHYQTHWWRCDGPCQSRGPYYGVVKRSMNRAPGPNDFWFAEHQANCGGTFIKIKEPEGYKAKKPKKLKTEENSNTTIVKSDNKQHQLTDYFPSPDKSYNISQVKSGVLNSRPKTGNDFAKHSLMNNVHGFKNLEQPMKNVEVPGTKSSSGTSKSKDKQHQLTDYFPSPNKSLNDPQVKSKDVNSKQKSGNNFAKHTSLNNIHGFKNLEQPMKKVGVPSTNSSSGTAKPIGRGSGFGVGMMSNRGGTMVMKPRTGTKASTSGGVETSVSVAVQYPREFTVFTGTGYTLGSGSGSANDRTRSRLLQSGSSSQGASKTQVNKPETTLKRETVAAETFKKEIESLDVEGFESDCEEETDRKMINCLVCGQCVRLVDINSHLEDCQSLSRVYDNIVVIDDSDEEMEVSDNNDCVECPCCSVKVPQEKINDHLDECLKSE